MPLGRFSRRGPGDGLVDLATIQDHRPMVHPARARGALSDGTGNDPASRTGRRSFRYREPSRIAAGFTDLDWTHGRDRRCRSARALARLGLGGATPHHRGCLSFTAELRRAKAPLTTALSP